MKTFALFSLVRGLFAFNQPITSDPYYGQKVGDIETYLRHLNSTPKSLFYTTNVGSSAGTLADAKYYASYAGLSYCSDTSLAAWNCKHCQFLGKSTTLHNILVDEAYNIRATIALDNKHNSIVLSFRGSVNSNNWIENLKFDKTAFIVGQVHVGFKNQADALLPYYESIIKQLMDQNPEYNLIIVGHSAGGAAALIAAIYLQMHLGLDWGRMHLFTYGQPRVGNGKFANWVNSLQFKMTRIVNENDIVPHIPPNFANYYHQHTELYINQGNPVFCKITNPEDSECSNSRVPAVSIDSHMSAFGIGLGSGYC